MLMRRIVGITGISLWAGLIVFAVVTGLQTEANGEQMFENLPEGWKIEESFVVPIDRTAAISLKLGGGISKLTNTVLSIEDRRLQVNVFHCLTEKEAEKIYEAVLKAHNGLAVTAAQDGKLVIEFAKCDDVNLINQARLALGLAGVRLDSVASKVIRKIPEGWQIEKSFIVPRDQTIDIGKKLGGRIKNLSNTIFSVEGQRFQVNVIECATPRAAEAIYNSILGMKDDPAFCLKYGDTVVEFVGDDVELAKKAPSALGFELKTEDMMEQTGQLDINAKVARLNIETATVDRVIRIFGEPTKYVWGKERFEKSNLPDRYILVYPDGFRIFMMNGRIVEHRHEGPDGYIWRGKLQVGSSLEEVLKVVGRPKKTVVGQPNKFEDGVLYKDIDGKEGGCYYGRERKGVRFFFRDYKVSALYVSRNDLSGRWRSRDAAKVPSGSASSESEVAKDNQLETMARDLVNSLVSGEYKEAVENFDSTMKKVLPAEKLEEVWNSVIAQAGPFVEQLGTRKEKILQYEAVFVTCKFENAVLDTKVVFDRKQQIAGLFFVPPQSPADK